MFENIFPQYSNRNIFWSRIRYLKIILSVICSGKIIYGNDTGRLEDHIQKMYQASSVLLTGNGNTGISLILQAIRKRFNHRRNVVLMPFYICPSVIHTVKNAQYTIHYTGILQDLTMDPAYITKKNLKNVAAVLIPHIYGYPAQIENIIKKIKAIDSDIFIIDDAAAAFGIHINGKFLGTFGDAGIISFSQGKLMNSCGGGVLLINNPNWQGLLEKLYERLPAPSPSEKLNSLLFVWFRYGIHRYSDPLVYWFSEYLFPVQRKMTDTKNKMANIDAAIANALICEIDNIHKKIFEIQQAYIKYFSESSIMISFPQFRKEYNFPVSKLCCIINEYNNKKFLSAGIKLYKAYREVPNQGHEYHSFRSNAIWLNKMIILPVDYLKDLSWHHNIVKKFKKICSY